jgi:hypothetical protein
MQADFSKLASKILRYLYGIAYNSQVKLRWTSFNRRVTDREFDALPLSDMVKLFEAMGKYARQVRAGYVVKEYGNGIKMIKGADYFLLRLKRS